MARKKTPSPTKRAPPSGSAALPNPSSSSTRTSKRKPTPTPKKVAFATSQDLVSTKEETRNAREEAAARAVTKYIMMRRSTREPPWIKRGLINEIDDNSGEHPFRSIEDIVAKLDRRRLTKTDKRMISGIKAWKWNMREQKWEHQDEDEDEVGNSSPDYGERIFAEERRLSKTGQALDCHAEIYWKFRQFWESRFKREAHPEEEEEEEDRSSEKPTPQQTSSSSPPASPPFRYEDFLEEAKNATYLRSKYGLSPLPAFEPFDKQHSGARHAREYEDSVRAGERMAHQEAIGEVDATEQEELVLASYLPAGRTSGAVSPESRPAAAIGTQSESGDGGRRGRASVHKGTAVLRKSEPSAPGRGSMRSATNPEFVLDERGDLTRTTNPFFETMPSREVWHRRMPAIFPFGETPYMEAAMSRQIEDDLNRVHGDDPEEQKEESQPGFMQRVVRTMSLGWIDPAIGSSSKSATSPHSEPEISEEPLKFPSVWDLPPPISSRATSKASKRKASTQYSGSKKRAK